MLKLSVVAQWKCEGGWYCEKTTDGTSQSKHTLLSLWSINAGMQCVLICQAAGGAMNKCLWRQFGEECVSEVNTALVLTAAGSAAAVTC